MSSSQWDWSTTAGSNTTVGGVSVAENMNPANVNNAMRAIMAGLKNSMWGGTSAGTANAQTVSLGNAPAAYVAGMAIWFMAGNTNTGATTLNVNSLGTKNVFANNAACTGGEIQSGELHLVVYDGTQFQLQRGGSSVGLLNEESSAPSTGANQGAIYTKESGGQTELFFREESNGDEVQVTSGGKLAALNQLSSSESVGTGSSYVKSGIPSWATRVIITIKDLSTNGGAVPVLRLGTTGGLSTTNYAARSGFVIDGASTVVSAGTTGFPLGDSWSAALILTGTIDLHVHDIPNDIWNMYYVLSREDQTQLVLGAGQSDLSGSLERIGLVTTDSFDDGTVSVYYE